MSQLSLEERVAALEQQVARLSAFLQNPNDVMATDWRSTIGMFADDSIMKEIIEEGRRIRELDRLTVPTETAQATPE